MQNVLKEKNFGLLTMTLTIMDITPLWVVREQLNMIMMKYINYAADEARRHISDQEIEDDEWEEGDDYEEC